MSETISACENICRDLSWLGPTTEWLRNLAIIFGVIAAWRQLDSWRREKIIVRKAEFAEELYSIAFEVGAKISVLRSPVGYGPPSGEEDDGTYDFQRRLRELSEMDDDFSKLRLLKVRQKAFLGDDDLDVAIAAFFQVRGEIIRALTGRIREIRRNSSHGAPVTERMIDRLDRYDSIIWEGGDHEGVDSTKNQIDDALTTIEDKAIPLIRLEY